jgi:hypothetical protein
VAKKKGKKKTKSAKKTERDECWEAVDEPDVDDRQPAAYARMMVAEEILYKRWEQNASPMNWVGELLSYPVDQPGTWWLLGLGDKVAALGGHLEVVAIFGDERVTLLREPALGGESPDLLDHHDEDDHPDT